MKKALIVSALSILLLACLTDYIRTNKSIKHFKETTPQLHSAVEACVYSYLQFDTVLLYNNLSNCSSEHIMIRPDLKAFRNRDISIEFNPPGESYTYPLALSVYLKQNVKTSSDRLATSINLDHLNYWSIRFSKRDVSLFSLTLSDVLTRWINEYTIAEIEEEFIELESGRPGGKISGKIESFSEGKIMISKEDWLIEAEIPLALNFIKETSDSCVIQGMFKNKDLAKRQLRLDPAIVYNIGDTTFYKE